MHLDHPAAIRIDVSDHLAVSAVRFLPFLRPFKMAISEELLLVLTFGNADRMLTRIEEMT